MNKKYILNLNSLQPVFSENKSNPIKTTCLQSNKFNKFNKFPPKPFSSPSATFYSLKTQKTFHKSLPSMINHFPIDFIRKHLHINESNNTQQLFSDYSTQHWPISLQIYEILLWSTANVSSIPHKIQQRLKSAKILRTYFSDGIWILICDFFWFLEVHAWMEAGSSFFLCYFMVFRLEAILE